MGRRFFYLKMFSQLVRNLFRSSSPSCYFHVFLVLSDECRRVIEFSESIGFESLSGLYPEDYRNNDRIMVDDPDFTAIFHQRLSPFLDSFIDDEGLVKASSLYGLNERLRICRYKAGGVFEKHTDGCTRLENPKRKSFYTVMMYLNTVQPDAGGSTRFYSRGEIIGAISPKIGSVVIFEHGILHDGEYFAGPNGKYILRSDTLFPV
jgi:hypothetical protein